MKKTLLFVFGLFTIASFSQDVKRIEIKGSVIVATQDKEGVTVYNSSSNKGTTTDENGDFEIKVGLNDIVEFGALQFKDFKVTINENVIKSKQLTVILVEEVNKLDEVVILPFGLTGNLDADLENVRTYNVSLDDVYFGLDHISDFEFSPDYKTKADNLAFNEYNPTMGNMLNVVNLAGFLVSQIVDFDGDKDNTTQEKEVAKTPFKKALDQYSVNYMHSNFNIPLNKVDAFIHYVEKEGIDETLLEKDKEMQFLERITQLSKSYLKLESEKD
ncbi:carboxypeptidase-like regulatory domain-containing protein [Winogradskyella sp. PG-2]|uniref:carboxypeptidase-like regulatory domain-containing protein n=1 Tax=Winogradskyella sp. PG-2 TaxID=754409 RepID=UPI00045893D9|nr:carboxypeptidase-like regulatory domain-containing protein [Winogradskyella sp. PG-2]BAO76263.1 hypothetical protein WPG_2033 [Winogradskyella sp. PG-2]